MGARTLRKAGVPTTEDHLTYVRVLLAPDDEPTNP
jgi:hypothetical protein